MHHSSHNKKKVIQSKNGLDGENNIRTYVWIINNWGSRTRSSHGKYARGRCRSFIIISAFPFWRRIVWLFILCIAAFHCVEDTRMNDVDLSSFPLLRIDQIHIHDTTTLITHWIGSTAYCTWKWGGNGVNTTIRFEATRSYTEGDRQSKSRWDDNVNSKESGCNAEKSMPIPLTSSFISSKRINKTPHRRDRIMPITFAKKVAPTTMQRNSSSLATLLRHRKQHRNNTRPKSKSILSSTFTSTTQQHLHLLHNNNIIHPSLYPIVPIVQSQTTFDHVPNFPRHLSNHVPYQCSKHYTTKTRRTYPTYETSITTTIQLAYGTRTKSTQDREQLAIAEAAAASARIVDDESTALLIGD